MRNLLNLLKPRTRQASANVARERLQIIVSHEATQANDPDFIPKLQNELLEVISKYVNIDREKIRVQLERSGEHSVLELNVSLTEDDVAAATTNASTMQSQNSTEESSSSATTNPASASKPTTETITD